MTGLGTMFAGGERRGEPTPARPRQADDFYPTPVEATRALLEIEGEQLRSQRFVWEPAAGDGAIARELSAIGCEVWSSDIVDRGWPLQARRDFLAFEACPFGGRPCAIVTNPPFSLAARFLRHARRLDVDCCALLLKATWWHAAERLPLWRTWPPAAVYPLTWRLDFLNLGRPVLEAAWVVWDRTHRGPCEYRPLPRPADPRQPPLIGGGV